MALNVLYSLLISLLGVPAGIIVGLVAAEELAAGLKYLKAICLLLLIGLTASLFYVYRTGELLPLFSFIFLEGIPLGSLLVYYRNSRKTHSSASR